jgi:hypothetical protein
LALSLQPRELHLYLFAPVVPTACSFKVLGTKVEIKLAKAAPFQWDDLVNKVRRMRGGTRVWGVARF